MLKVDLRVDLKIIYKQYTNMSNFKYYAVHRGRKVGVYTSWEDCVAQIHGYPQNKFRAFSNVVEAKYYVQHGTLKSWPKITRWFMPKPGTRRPFEMPLRS